MVAPGRSGLADLLDLLGGAQLAQAAEGSVDDRDMVLRTHRLGQHVVDTGSLEDRTNATTRDDTGTVGGWAKEDLAAIVDTEDFMGNRGALEGHGHHVLAGVLGTLANRFGNFVGLAVADADAALPVADDGEGGEAEATATFDDLRAAVDKDDLLDEAGFVGVGAAATAVGGRESFMFSD